MSRKNYRQKMTPLIQITLNDKKQAITNVNVGAVPLEAYAILISDLVRHVALAHKVKAEVVWEMIEREKGTPTAKVIGYLDKVH